MTDKEGLRKLLCPDEEVDTAIRVLEKLDKYDRERVEKGEQERGERGWHSIVVLEFDQEELRAATRLRERGLIGQVTEKTPSYRMTSSGEKIYKNYSA